MGSENNSNTFSPEQTGSSNKRKIVIAGVDIETQARDMAEEKLTVAKGELKGVRGFFKKIWKHNLAHEYYRQKEIAKAKREIKQSGNLYAGEGGDKADHVDAMKAIIERFVTEYEADGLLRSGEEKKLLKGKNAEESKIKSSVQDLVKKFAIGSITEDEFKSEKNKFFSAELGSMRGSQGELLAQKDSLYADNLLEIAKQIKDDIAHGKGLDALDFDFDVIIGRAKAGVETEAQYNVVDRIVEKFKKTAGGRFVSHFVNEATVASAVAIAYGFGVKGTIGAAQKAAKWVGPLGLELSAGIGGAVAGARENKRFKEDRAQHIREMAKGKEVEAGSKRREEMEKFRYETKNANDLTANLYVALTKLQSNPSPEQLNEVLGGINEIDARISFSEREKIDLISFSDAKRVEQERTRMYVATAEAKVYLKKNVDQKWAASLKDEAGLNDYLSHLKETKIQADFKKEKELKDEIFDKMKRKKVAWAAVKGLGIGVGVGMAFQEIQAAVGSTQEGIFHSGNAHNSDSVRHFTSLEYLRRYVSGDLPKVDAGLPHTITEHIDGSEQSLNIGAKDYIKNHENLFSRITRGHWADNDSLRPDKNELKLWWGGEKGTGLDSSGNYVFNVKHMAPGGSSHGNSNWNPQELMQEGKMKLLVSLSHDTQNQVAEIPIDASGNAIIDPNSEIGKLAFQNINGHAKFIGKLAEVAVMGENKGGTDYVDILATHEGKGIDNITEVVRTAARDIETVIPGKPSDYDVDSPYAIPVAWRNPLERMKTKTLEESQPQLVIEVSEKEKNRIALEREKEDRERQLEMPDAFYVAVVSAAVANAKEATPERKLVLKKTFNAFLAANKILQEARRERNLAQAEAEARNEDEARGLAKAQAKTKTIQPPATERSRNASDHTIYNLKNSPRHNFTYDDLYAQTVEEGDRKFLELTRKLWNELTIHGFNKFDPVTKTLEFQKSADQDANSCLKILQLAGFNVDLKEINYVPQGASADSGVIMDTSMTDGVTSEDEGKRLIFDHHGPNSDRTTSATRHVYETLVELGLIQREKYLDNFVEFVTKCDNMNFDNDELSKVYANFSKNLFGLHGKLKLETILELIRNGTDPWSDLPEDFLKNTTYYNPGKKIDEPLIEYSKFIENQIKNGENALKKMEKEGVFIIDTGKDRFGKIVVDTKQISFKGGRYPKISGEGKSNQLTVFMGGYDGYLLWDPSENSFTLFTKKKMDDTSLPGGFSQGFNMRGNMWTKPVQDLKPLTISLDEILSGLAGRKFIIEGKLKDALKKEGEANKRAEVKKAMAVAAAKKAAPSTQPAMPNQPPAPKSVAETAKEKQEKMSNSLKVLKDSFSTFELSYDAIKAEAQKSQVSPAELAVQFIQNDDRLRASFGLRLNSLFPRVSDRNDKAIEGVAITILLEEERRRVRDKIRNEGENDVLNTKLLEIEADLMKIEVDKIFGW